MKKKRTWLWIFILLVCFAIIYTLFVKGPTRSADFNNQLNSAGIGKPNVLFITLDTTRADRLACYGYDNVETPVLDNLAAKGILFEYCISPVSLTLPSHCSMMTGLYPTYHGVRINGNTALSQSHQTLAELFSSNGYSCGAFIAAFVLDGRWGLKQGFHHYDDQFDLKKYKQIDLGRVQRPGHEIVDAALAWLNANKNQPFFSWVHLYDPHTPYNPPEPFLSRYRDRGREGLYDGEIAYTDQQVGRIIDWLADNGLDKNTIVIIMGDHGEALGSHGEMTHGYFIYDYAIRVPLIIRTPIQAISGIRVKSQVRILDIYPTILHMAGIQIPQENQGRSLIPLFYNPDSEFERFAYSESMSPNIQYGWGALQSLRTLKYKYIDAPRPELYDLVNDPEEEVNLRFRYPDMVKEFKEELNQFINRTSQGAPTPEAANLDENTQRRLASLGYIGAPVSTKKGRFLADPKDKLEIFATIEEAVELINQEDYEKSARILSDILEKESFNPQAKLLLATSYTKLEKMEQAKKELDDILKDDPNSIKALVMLGNILADEGKTEDVIAIAKKALSVDERNTQAHMLIGEVYMKDNNHSKALSFLQKAVEIQPKLTRNQQNLAICLLGLNKYEEAESKLNKVIEQNPKFPMAHYHLALLKEGLGMASQARDAYIQEIALHKDFIPARFNLGRLLLKQGDRQGYVQQMREIVKINPKSAKGFLFLARGLLYESNDFDAILDLVNKGLQYAQESQLKALGYFLLADIYNRKKEPARVQEALKKANYYREKTKQEK